jgi:hypothetical protein
VCRKQAIYRCLNLLELQSVTWDSSYFNDRRHKSAFKGDLSEIAAKKNVRESFKTDG